MLTNHLRFRAGVAVWVAAAIGCTSPSMDRVSTPQLPSGSAARDRRSACGLPPAQLSRVARGYRPGRSGDVQFLPVPKSYFGERSHSGPWPYLQRVPLVLYGPGHVPAAGRVRRPVTLADVSPTIASHLRFRFDAPDGRPLREALPREARQPPRLIVTVVWDGGGRDVLAEHPSAWPALRGLRERGAWFENATVASSPSVSPAVHGTLSTGAFPRRHGLVDMVVRARGDLVGVEEDPTLLRLPTIGDAFDRARGNRPIVGLVAHPLAVSMLGRGSSFPGGDEDVAVIESGSGWAPPEGGSELFRFPRYVGRVAGLEGALRGLDRSDGEPDEEWMGSSLDDPEIASATPAFSEHQTRVVIELIRREGFGEDAVPDLLFVNYNQINEVGHLWSMNSPQMREVVAANDRAIAELVRFLDREVGRRRWVLIVTADHGSTPDASVSGAFVIDEAELASDLRTAFDTDRDGASAVHAMRVTQLWLDPAEARAEGVSPAGVAAFLRGYTRGDNRSDPALLDASAADAPVFAAAFSSSVLDRDCGS